MPDGESDAHASPAEQVLRDLGSSAEGLSASECERRFAQAGPNRLDAVRTESALAILLEQFTSVVVALLIAAAITAFFLGERLDAAAIGVVLLLNAALGFITEYRARRAIASLLRLDVPRASVVRQGELIAIDAQALVPGDIIVLSRGQRVPADGRVLVASDLRVDEASLTGESLPVSKIGDQLPPPLLSPSAATWCTRARSSLPEQGARS